MTRSTGTFGYLKQISDELHPQQPARQEADENSAVEIGLGFAERQAKPDTRPAIARPSAVTRAAASSTVIMFL